VAVFFFVDGYQSLFFGAVGVAVQDHNFKGLFGQDIGYNTTIDENNSELFCSREIEALYGSVVELGDVSDCLVDETDQTLSCSDLEVVLILGLLKCVLEFVLDTAVSVLQTVDVFLHTFV